MTSKVRLSPRARRDLVQLWRYVASDNERAADALIDRVDDILLMLGDNPNAGRARPELGDTVRSFPVASYILFYRPTAGGVELVRVLGACLDIQPDDLD